MWNGSDAVGARRRILIVEDDLDLRESLLADLEDSGHELMSAVDGAEALAMMRKRRPDLVVLDLLMPIMDGWQFRIAQRADPDLARVPVIAMSASHVAAARAVDADLFLEKPFPGGVLRRAIDDLVVAHERSEALEHETQREHLSSLGTLAAGLAHEINNPLTAVLLNLCAAERLLPSMQGDPDHVAQLRGVIAQAVESAERIRGVVRSVRILSREEREARTPIDVRATLDSILTMEMSELRSRARLITAYEEVPFVFADEGRLGQVFMNLITNAVQAIPPGAPDDNQVRVSTHSDEDGHAVIEIADTGAGIPDCLRTRIFEPFFTTRKTGEGTGLGLSISQRIVTSLGGTIDVSSELGRGATFRVTLPGGHHPAR
jgi:signal transduction histidine kinase